VAILRLTSCFSHGINPVCHLASFLGSGKGLKLNGTDFETGVDTEVVSRNRRGDETRPWRLEVDRPYLYASDNLVFQPLVIDLNIIVTVKVPLRIEVHIDMHPSAYGASGTEVHLIVEARSLEAATTAGIRIE
jgi:hypothetical protein